MLVKGLPATSRLQTKMRDTIEVEPADPDEPVHYGPWSTVNYQLATLTDAVLRVKEAVERSVGGDVTPAEPMPRPQMRTRRDAASDDVDPERVIELLEGIRELHRREVEQA